MCIWREQLERFCGCVHVCGKFLCVRLNLSTSLFNVFSSINLGVEEWWVGYMPRGPAAELDRRQSGWAWWEAGTCWNRG